MIRFAVLRHGVYFVWWHCKMRRPPIEAADDATVKDAGPELPAQAEDYSAALAWTGNLGFSGVGDLIRRRNVRPWYTRFGIGRAAAILGQAL